MKEFYLEIVCPTGKVFEGNAQKIVVATPRGPVCIMAGHIDYFTAIESGRVRVLTDGAERRATTTGGIMSVGQNKVKIVTSSFEWC